MQEVTVEHLPSGNRSSLKVDGVFIFVGYMPNTSSLNGVIQLNDQQEIVVDEKLQTNLPGVFAAGDCIPKKYRQVTTAVADGTVAVEARGRYFSLIGDTLPAEELEAQEWRVYLAEDDPGELEI